MKRLIVAAGIFALAACAKPASEEAAPAAEETPVVAAAGAGTYDYASADGAVAGRIVMNEDGTFEDTQADGTVQTGSWRAGEGQTCFTGSEDGSAEICWTDGEPAEDGTFSSTSPDGVTVTVTPVPAEPAAEPADAAAE